MICHLMYPMLVKFLAASLLGLSPTIASHLLMFRITTPPVIHVFCELTLFSLSLSPLCSHLPLPTTICSYFHSLPSSLSHSKALKRAKVLLGMRHSHAKLENIWGVGGGQQPLSHLIEKVRTTQYSLAPIIAIMSVY